GSGGVWGSGVTRAGRIWGGRRARRARAICRGAARRGGPPPMTWMGRACIQPKIGAKPGALNRRGGARTAPGPEPAVDTGGRRFEEEARMDLDTELAGLGEAIAARLRQRQETGAIAESAPRGPISAAPLAVA